MSEKRTPTLPDDCREDAETLRNVARKLRGRARKHRSYPDNPDYDLTATEKTVLHDLSDDIETLANKLEVLTGSRSSEQEPDVARTSP